MAEVVNEDVVEQILIEIDVKDLIRFKTVCKSWHSLITSPRFVNRHLIRSYNKDRNNKEIGHRRIGLVNFHPYHHVGSSNGLICLASSSLYADVKFSVANPLTREVTQLRDSPWKGFLLCLCWGFGYDSSIDDYKVIVGVEGATHKTCFKVLSLKSNVWRLVGVVKYSFITKVGLLCNGALHWIVRDENTEDMKNLIICYDLCKQEFLEIPLPEGASYIRLGVMQEFVGTSAK
ncbi:putative F-box domain-containing protein [Helianthus anomalus]